MSERGAPTAFARLGIEPTLDAAAVKRAYFARIRERPPHADPASFRELRAAYEVLATSEGRVLAYLRAPLDARAELARWQARHGAAVDEARARARTEWERRAALERFIERFSRMRLADALEAAEPDAARGSRFALGPPPRSPSTEPGPSTRP